jgi:hypothetical protein
MDHMLRRQRFPLRIGLAAAERSSLDTFEAARRFVAHDVGLRVSRPSISSFDFEFNAVCWTDCLRPQTSGA